MSRWGGIHYKKGIEIGRRGRS
ncbi:hypothetical protein NC651_020814 [Populus alba x Populus x berolinensis]|nr:hypothetical protein NC651_020814 [Populus alba x Populus x berolinensis]